MTLPPEVLALLGPDATPDQQLEWLRASTHGCVFSASQGYGKHWAVEAYRYALAAAAIELAEALTAPRRCNADPNDPDVCLDDPPCPTVLHTAATNYRAIRDARRPR